MTTFKEIFLSPDFWKFVIPLTGAVIAWFVNEWRKRVADQYQRKEASYKELIRSLRGFYESSSDLRLRNKFLEELNIAWLYCPDEVIRKAYVFLNTVHTDCIHEDEQKERAMSEFMLAVRKDLLSRKLLKSSSLTAEEFKHLQAQ